MRATVLFSGGVDSTSCIHLLQDIGYEVAAVFVDFGQPAAKIEKRTVANLCRRLSIPITVLKSSGSASFGTGELTGRNAFLIFSTLLLGGCRDGLLVIGVHAGTSYYDCSPTFVNSIDQLVRECTNGRVAVSAPLLNWTKGEIYHYFAKTELSLSETYSCEAGNSQPCDSCASCRDRARFECLLSDAS
jgi:7-cyano-7-deazaguanine synthase